MKISDKTTICRNLAFNEKVVFIDGQPGCGKSMLSPIISSLERGELSTYLFEVEWACRLHHLEKIEKDASESLIKMLVDFKLYNTMMGREVNFRFSDLSSAFNDVRPLRYFKRIFQRGDNEIPSRIKKMKPILNVATHNLLGMSELIFESLKNRAILIEVVRHPLYMIVQQTLNFERLLHSPRDVRVSIEYKKGSSLFRKRLGRTILKI